MQNTCQKFVSKYFSTGQYCVLTHHCGLECWPPFFPPSCLLLQRAYLNAYYFASFVEILHRLRDTSQTLGGLRPRGNGRLPLQRLAPSHFATF